MNENLDNKYSPENAEHTGEIITMTLVRIRQISSISRTISISSPISSISRTISPDMIREWIRSR